MLRCCAHDDLGSLLSAAQAHSRLHQAVEIVATSLTTVTAKVPEQQQVDSVLLYLSKCGQRVDSIDLQGPSNDGLGHAFYRSLHQLPHTKLQGLSSLCFSEMRVQMQPRDGFQGVICAGSPIKRLRFDHCQMRDGVEGLSAVLALLPELQHLSFVKTKRFSVSEPESLDFPIGAVQGLQQLTFLEVAAQCWEPNCWWPGHWSEYPDVLRHLLGLTRLQDLRLPFRNPHTVTASALSALQRITRLTVNASLGYGERVFQPGALVGKTQLQHLEVVGYNIAGASTGVAQLMSYLQHLQQLAILNLSHTLIDQDAVAPEEVYSALTASSELHRLSICGCILPAGVWQHMFPAGRLLPRLQSLDICGVLFPAGPAPAPHKSLLATCCPGLRVLTQHHCNMSPHQPLPSSSQGVTPTRAALAGLPVHSNTVGRQLPPWHQGLPSLEINNMGSAKPSPDLERRRITSFCLGLPVLTYNHQIPTSNARRERLLQSGRPLHQQLPISGPAVTPTVAVGSSVHSNSAGRQLPDLRFPAIGGLFVSVGPTPDLEMGCTRNCRRLPVLTQNPTSNAGLGPRDQSGSPVHQQPSSSSQGVTTDTLVHNNSGAASGSRVCNGIYVSIQSM